MKQRKLYVVKFFESGRIEYFKAYCFDDVLDYLKSKFPCEDFFYLNMNQFLIISVI